MGNPALRPREQLLASIQHARDVISGHYQEKIRQKIDWVIQINPDFYGIELLKRQVDTHDAAKAAYQNKLNAMLRMLFHMDYPFYEGSDEDIEMIIKLKY